MLELLLPVIFGAFIFFVTGLDDLMVIFNLIHQENKARKWAVLAGTLLGTTLMFAFCLFVIYLLKNLTVFEKITGLLKYFLVIPVFFALKVLYGNLSTKSQRISKSVVKSPYNYAILACLIYLSNMSDDIIVNSTVLLNLHYWGEIISLGLGNLLGCSFMYWLADRFSQRIWQSQYKKVIIIISALIIIILALRIAWS